MSVVQRGKPLTSPGAKCHPSQSHSLIRRGCLVIQVDLMAGSELQQNKRTLPGSAAESVGAHRELGWSEGPSLGLHPGSSLP